MAEELFQEREKARRQEVDKENTLKKASTNQAGREGQNLFQAAEKVEQMFRDVR